MARIAKRTRGGPYPVTIGGETKYICGCGLSNTQPFCNGTHKISREEDPSKLYWYDEQGNRFETTDVFQGIRCRRTRRARLPGRAWLLCSDRKAPPASNPLCIFHPTSCAESQAQSKSLARSLLHPLHGSYTNPLV